jgi:hypothetical protein
VLARSIIGAAAVSAGLALTAAPAGAATSPATAHTSGGDPAPPLPSLVQTRLTRMGRALDTLTDDINDANSAHAAKSSKVVRRQLAAAWRGAKYYIQHAPPPPPADRAARVPHGGTVRLNDLPEKVRAKVAGGAIGPAIADPVVTAMAVFDGFHLVSGTIIELTDGARVPVLDDMSRTLFFALDRRDKAIQDVHTLAPPAPAPADRRAVAHTSGGAVVGTFDTAMPGETVFLDDELQHIDGLQTDATDLRPGGQRILAKARTQISTTEGTINTLWPPVPAEG